MTIDTKDVTSWLKTHLVIAVPIGLAFLAWFAAMRWQAAITQSQIALAIFYFSVCATSGVTSAVLTIAHLIRLGLFNGAFN